MAKNIFIFADGTGQRGGLRPDQRLSNVYKLFRAVRPGPFSPISYDRQYAYYDPGLGAGEEGARRATRLKRFFESAFGAGIEGNMIDCYEKIISHYEDGDRIILIGFSRGAYTVRALANMMNLCGVPKHLPDGKTLVPKSGDIVRKIAKEAVVSVYGHGSGKPRGEDPYRREREEKGRRFRNKYGCQENGDPDDVRSNVEPYFIGVFDTVAALQNKILFAVTLGLAVLLLCLSVASSFLNWWWLSFIFGCGFLVMFGAYLTIYAKQTRYFEPNPDKPLRWYKPWHWRAIGRHTHHCGWDNAHYDKWLSPKVVFARHAIAIDEARERFPRVAWGLASTPNKPDEKGRLWLDQTWFAGCHSDVGGSYPEDESRLSDIALQWMIDELKECVPCVQIRTSQVQTNPNPLGLQHEEKYIWWKIPWRKKLRAVDPEGRLHHSVWTRLAADAVPKPGRIEKYNPPQLAQHRIMPVVERVEAERAEKSDT